MFVFSKSTEATMWPHAYAPPIINAFYDASTIQYHQKHNLYTKSMKTVQFVDLPSNMLAYLHIHTHTRRHTNRGESKKKQERPGWHSVRGVQLYSWGREAEKGEVTEVFKIWKCTMHHTWMTPPSMKGCPPCVIHCVITLWGWGWGGERGSLVQEIWFVW